MGYYEQKKKELENLLSLIRSEKTYFEGAAQQERKSLDEKINWNEKLREGVTQMAKERQIGFPWLAKAYDELFKLEEHKLTNWLTQKKHPAVSSAEIVKEQSSLRRQAEKEKKIAQYLVEYYEYLVPSLVDLKEELGIATEQERELLKEYSEEELQDEVTQYLTKEEYRKLPSVERNQMALDRFWKRPKSKWLIGRMYERYIGYLFETQDYDVEYVGIFKGFEDLGRDLICQKKMILLLFNVKIGHILGPFMRSIYFNFSGLFFNTKIKILIEKLERFSILQLNSLN